MIIDIVYSAILNYSLPNSNSPYNRFDIHRQYRIDDQTRLFKTYFYFEGDKYDIICFEPGAASYRQTTLPHSSWSSSEWKTLHDRTCTLDPKYYNRLFDQSKARDPLPPFKSVFAGTYFVANAKPYFFPIYKASYNYPTEFQGDDYVCAIRTRALKIHISALHNHIIGYVALSHFQYSEAIFIPFLSKVFSINQYIPADDFSRASQLQFDLSNVGDMLFHTFSYFYLSTSITSTYYDVASLPEMGGFYEYDYLSLSRQEPSTFTWKPFDNWLYHQHVQSIGNVCDGFYPSP